MSTATIPWEQYQQLAPDQRRRPLTDAEYAALTPQQRIALGLDENEQGAPADFNGPVIPNPTHIQPRFDTDPRIDPTRLPEGVTFQHGNWSGNPQMDVSNPAAADVQPAMGREVGAKMSAQPIDFSKYEQAPAGGIDFSKYEGAPAQSGQSAPHDQFAEDRATTEAWAQKHPVLGPIVRFLVAGGQNAANAITDTPGQLYHAIVDPPEPEEAGMKPEQRVIYRLGIKQAVHAGADYASGQVTPKGAASVMPEALGAGVGQVSGGAVYGKAAEIAPELAGAAAEAVPKVIRAARNVTPKQIAQVAGTATGAGLGHGTLSVPGAYYGAKGAGAIAESVLGKTRANAPIFGGEPAPANAAGSMAESVAAPTPQPAPVTPAQLEGPLNDALGGQKLQPGVSLRNQPAAMAAARGKLPEGFTPVDSSVLKGYKYDPDTQEFTAITQNGQSYTHGEVTPDQVAAFEKSPSQGKAWTSEIRNNNVLVKKNGLPVRPGVKPEAEPTQAAPASPDLTQQLQDSLDAVRSKKASAGANARGQQPSVDVNSVFNRLVKGEAGQAGLPGAVTNFDEGIADIQKQPVISQKTGQVPASGFLNKVGADRASILKTPQDAQSVFYHRQQIAQNGPPDVELHLDEGGNVIGADGRHRALAAIEHGGANAKVNVTIYKHPYQSAPE